MEERDPPTPALLALLQGQVTLKPYAARRTSRVTTALRAWVIRLLGAPRLELHCPKCGTLAIVIVDRSGTALECNACLVGINLEAQIEHHRRHCCHCGEPGPGDAWRS